MDCVNTNTDNINGIREDKVGLIGGQIAYSGPLAVFQCQICGTDYKRQCNDDCDPAVFGYVNATIRSVLLHCWNCLNKHESSCLKALWMNRGNTLFVTLEIPRDLVQRVDEYWLFETTKGKIKTSGRDLVRFLANMKKANGEEGERIMFKNSKGEACRVSFGNYIGIPFDKQDKKDLILVLEKERERKDGEYVSSYYEYEFITLLELIDSNPFLKEILAYVKLDFHVNEFDFELKNVDSVFTEAVYDYTQRLNEKLFNKALKTQIGLSLPYDLYEKIMSYIGEVRIKRTVFEVDE